MEKRFFFRVEFTCGPTVVARKFVKGLENDTIGNLLHDNMPEGDYGIRTVTGCSGSNSTNNKTSIEVSMPVPCLYEFGVKELTVQLTASTDVSDTHTVATSESKSRNAFDLLMSLQRKYDSLPEPRYVA